MKLRLMALLWNSLFIAGSAVGLRGVWMWSHAAALVLAGIEIAVVGFLGGIDQARRWTGDESWH